MIDVLHMYLPQGHRCFASASALGRHHLSIADSNYERPGKSGTGRALPRRSMLLGDTGRAPYLRYSLVLEGHQASRVPFLRKHPLPHPQPKIPQKQDRIMFQVGAGVGEDEFWQQGNQEIGQGEEED